MELTKERMLDIAKAFKWNAKNMEINCSKCGATVMQHSEEEIAFYGKIVELLQADADGRCVVLPCKVGDTVYSIHSAGLSKPMIATLEIDLFFLILAFCEGRFGKTVFLTREEAEKALKGGVENA